MSLILQAVVQNTEKLEIYTGICFVTYSSTSFDGKTNEEIFAKWLSNAYCWSKEFGAENK